jgi:hypothetical protein
MAVVDAKRALGFGLAHPADPALTRQDGLIFIPRQAVGVLYVLLFHLRGILLSIEPPLFGDFRLVGASIGTASRLGFLPELRAFRVSPPARLVVGSHRRPPLKILRW